MEQHCIVLHRETRSSNMTATIEGVFNHDKDRLALIADLEEAGWRLVTSTPRTSDTSVAKQ